MNEMDFFMLTLFIPLSCIWTFHRAETQRHSKWCLEEFGAFKHTSDQIISAVMRKHEARSKNQTYQCNSDYDAIKIFCCSALHCNAHSSACATFSLFCCCIDSRCFLFYAIVIFFFFLAYFYHCIPGWLIQRKTAHWSVLNTSQCVFGHNSWPFLCMFMKLISYLQPFIASMWVLCVLARECKTILTPSVDITMDDILHCSPCYISIINKHSNVPKSRNKT